jgi:release factor glutamine methyltransferase
MTDKPERVIDLITVAAEHMKSRGFEDARLEVERLLGSVLGLSRIELYLGFDRPVSEAERDRFRALYRRRLAHEPLQHLLGETDFREVTLKTDRRALIPRPETELLVEIAVEFLRGRDHPLVADLGTGTGAIAVSVAYEVPGARVVAVDISDDALLLADRNARELGVQGAITLVSGDMLGALEGRGPFDAILSNPPYIRSGEIESLQPEVRDHEPKIALDGGPDGMEYLRAIIAGAHRFLKPGGLILLECGEGQGEALKKFAEETGRYGSVEVIPDLAGKDRVIKAVRKE